MKSFFNKIITLLGAYLLDLFIPIWPFIGIVIFLIMADRISGVWRAKKNNQVITEVKWLDTLKKIILYFLAIVTCRLVEVHVLQDGEIEFLKFFPFTWWVVFYITLHEVRSILRNVGDHNGAPIWEQLTALYKKLTSKNNGQA